MGKMDKHDLRRAMRDGIIGSGNGTGGAPDGAPAGPLEIQVDVVAGTKVGIGFNQPVRGFNLYPEAAQNLARRILTTTERVLGDRAPLMLLALRAADLMDWWAAYPHVVKWTVRPAELPPVWSWQDRDGLWADCSDLGEALEQAVAHWGWNAGDDVRQLALFGAGMYRSVAQTLFQYLNRHPTRVVYATGLDGAEDAGWRWRDRNGDWRWDFRDSLEATVMASTRAWGNAPDDGRGESYRALEAARAQYDNPVTPGAPMEEPDPDPAPLMAFVQWKGTDVCMDVPCSCGTTFHVDGMGAFAVQCPNCGEAFASPSYVRLHQVPRGSATWRDAMLGFAEHDQAARVERGEHAPATYNPGQDPLARAWLLLVAGWGLVKDALEQYDMGHDLHGREWTEAARQFTIVYEGDYSGRDPLPMDANMPAMLERCWGILANAFHTDWTKASVGWRHAAAAWRDAWSGIAQPAADAAAQARADYGGDIAPELGA